MERKDAAGVRAAAGGLGAGAIDGLVVYDLDRLHRQPRELEAFIELCQRLRLTNVTSVSGDIDLTRSDGQFQARILGAVAKKESDDKSRRIRRKHEELAPQRQGRRVAAADLRLRGGQADACVPAEAAIDPGVRAAGFLAGESLRSIVADLNERGVPTASGGELVAADAAPDARLAADQRPARAQRRDRRDGRRGPRSSARRDGARIRARLARPGAAHEQGRPPLPARRAARLRPLRRAAGRAAADGRQAPLRLRAGARAFSGCGKTYINADEVERVRHRGRAAPARLRRARRARVERPPAQRTRRAALARTRSSRRRRSSRSSPSCYGQREITMNEWRAARKPIEQRMTSRPQAAGEGHAAPSALDGYVGNGEQLRAGLGVARPQPAARDRRRGRRPRRGRPRPPRLQPLRRVTPDAALLAALSKQLGDLLRSSADR